MQWSGKHCGLLQKEWRAQSSTAKRVELHSKQCRESGVLQQTAHRVQTAQYSNGNRVESTVLYCHGVESTVPLHNMWSSRAPCPSLAPPIQKISECPLSTPIAVEHCPLHYMCTGQLSSPLQCTRTVFSTTL